MYDILNKMLRKPARTSARHIKLGARADRQTKDKFEKTEFVNSAFALFLQKVCHGVPVAVFDNDGQRPLLWCHTNHFSVPTNPD
jgi:hypothetical protein